MDIKCYVLRRAGQAVALCEVFFFLSLHRLLRIMSYRLYHVPRRAILCLIDILEPGRGLYALIS